MASSKANTYAQEERTSDESSMMTDSAAEEPTDSEKSKKKSNANRRMQSRRIAFKAKHATNLSLTQQSTQLDHQMEGSSVVDGARAPRPPVRNASAEDLTVGLGDSYCSADANHGMKVQTCTNEKSLETVPLTTNHIPSRDQVDGREDAIPMLQYHFVHRRTSSAPAVLNIASKEALTSAHGAADFDHAAAPDPKEETSKDNEIGAQEQERGNGISSDDSTNAAVGEGTSPKISAAPMMEYLAREQAEKLARVVDTQDPATTKDEEPSSTVNPQITPKASREQKSNDRPPVVTNSPRGSHERTGRGTFKRRNPKSAKSRDNTTQHSHGTGRQGSVASRGGGSSHQATSSHSRHAGRAALSLETIREKSACMVAIYGIKKQSDSVSVDEGNQRETESEQNNKNVDSVPEIEQNNKKAATVNVAPVSEGVAAATHMNPHNPPVPVGSTDSAMPASLEVSASVGVGEGSSGLTAEKSTGQGKRPPRKGTKKKRIPKQSRVMKQKPNTSSHDVPGLHQSSGVIVNATSGTNPSVQVRAPCDSTPPQASEHASNLEAAALTASPTVPNTSVSTILTPKESNVKPVDNFRKGKKNYPRKKNIYEEQQRSLVDADPKPSVGEKGESTRKNAFTQPGVGNVTLNEELTQIPQKEHEIPRSKRQPRNQMVQIETLLQSLSTKDRDISAQVNRQGNSRGDCLLGGDPNDPDTSPELSRRGRYNTPPTTTRQGGSQLQRSLREYSRAQPATMDSSTPETYPAHVGFPNAQDGQNQSGTSGNTKTQPKLSTYTTFVAPATATTTANMQNHQVVAHDTLVTTTEESTANVRRADKYIKTPTSASKVRNSSAHIWPSADPRAKGSSAPLHNQAPQLKSTPPQLNQEINASLKQEFDEHGNYVPPHMRRPKKPVKVERDHDRNYVPPHLRKGFESRIHPAPATSFVKPQPATETENKLKDKEMVRDTAHQLQNAVNEAQAVTENEATGTVGMIATTEPHTAVKIVKAEEVVRGGTDLVAKGAHATEKETSEAVGKSLRPGPQTVAKSSKAEEVVRTGTDVVATVTHHTEEKTSGSSASCLNPSPQTAAKSSNAEGVVRTRTDVVATATHHTEEKTSGSSGTCLNPSPQIAVKSSKGKEVVRDGGVLLANTAGDGQGVTEKDITEAAVKNLSLGPQTPAKSLIDQEPPRTGADFIANVGPEKRGTTRTGTVGPVGKAHHPSPPTPQKVNILKNPNTPDSPSPGTGPSKQANNKRPSPWSRSPKLAANHSPEPQTNGQNKLKFRRSPNTDFGGGTEGGPNEMEDDDTQMQLHDWNGNWMPAPVEWDARPAFNNTSANFAASVHKWIEEESDKGVELIDVKQKGFQEGVALGTGMEIAYEVIPEEDQGDTQLYPEDEYTPTKLEQTSDASAKAYTAKVEIEAKTAKMDRKAIRAANKAYRETYVPPPNLHIPKANIYVRPAHVGDINQIMDIYAWYITHSVIAPERQQLDYQSWRSRMQDVDDCKLPFLVAVTKNNNNRNHRRNANNRETIVGFGFADLFAGQYDAFKYAVEMQVWVHHQHKRVGVGKTLIDRVLASLDPNYMSHNGTEFFAENTLDYDQGGRRFVGSVLITIPYDHKDDKEFEWQKKWLLEQWYFDHVATLPKIGFKDNKTLNFAYLRRETGTTVGPGMGM